MRRISFTAFIIATCFLYGLAISVDSKPFDSRITDEKAERPSQVDASADVVDGVSRLKTRYKSSLPENSGYNVITTRDEVPPQGEITRSFVTKSTNHDVEKSMFTKHNADSLEPINAPFAADDTNKIPQRSFLKRLKNRLLQFVYDHNLYFHHRRLLDIGITVGMRGPHLRAFKVTRVSHKEPLQKNVNKHMRFILFHSLRSMNVGSYLRRFIIRNIKNCSGKKLFTRQCVYHIMRGIGAGGHLSGVVNMEITNPKQRSNDMRRMSRLLRLHGRKIKVLLPISRERLFGFTPPKLKDTSLGKRFPFPKNIAKDQASLIIIRIPNGTKNSKIFPFDFQTKSDDQIRQNRHVQSHLAIHPIIEVLPTVPLDLQSKREVKFGLNSRRFVWTNHGKKDTLYSFDETLPRLNFHQILTNLRKRYTRKYKRNLIHRMKIQNKELKGFNKIIGKQLNASKHLQNKSNKFYRISGKSPSVNLSSTLPLTLNRTRIPPILHEHEHRREENGAFNFLRLVKFRMTVNIHIQHSPDPSWEFMKSPIRYVATTVVNFIIELLNIIYNFFTTCLSYFLYNRKEVQQNDKEIIPSMAETSEEMKILVLNKTKKRYIKGNLLSPYIPKVSSELVSMRHSLSKSLKFEQNHNLKTNKEYQNKMTRVYWRRTRNKNKGPKKQIDHKRFIRDVTGQIEPPDHKFADLLTPSIHGVQGLPAPGKKLFHEGVFQGQHRLEPFLERFVKKGRNYRMMKKNSSPQSIVKQQAMWGFIRKSGGDYKKTNDIRQKTSNVGAGQEKFGKSRAIFGMNSDVYETPSRDKLKSRQLKAKFLSILNLLSRKNLIPPLKKSNVSSDQERKENRDVTNVGGKGTRGSKKIPHRGGVERKSNGYKENGLPQDVIMEPRLNSDREKFLHAKPTRADWQLLRNLELLTRRILSTDSKVDGHPTDDASHSSRVRLLPVLGVGPLRDHNQLPYSSRHRNSLRQKRSEKRGSRHNKLAPRHAPMPRLSNSFPGQVVAKRATKIQTSVGPTDRHKRHVLEIEHMNPEEEVKLVNFVQTWGRLRRKLVKLQHKISEERSEYEASQQKILHLLKRGDTLANRVLISVKRNKADGAIREAALSKAAAELKRLKTDLSQQKMKTEARERKAMTDNVSTQLKLVKEELDREKAFLAAKENTESELSHKDSAISNNVSLPLLIHHRRGPGHTEGYILMGDDGKVETIGDGDQAIKRYFNTVKMIHEDLAAHTPSINTLDDYDDKAKADPDLIKVNQLLENLLQRSKRFAHQNKPRQTSQSRYEEKLHSLAPKSKRSLHHSVNSQVSLGAIPNMNGHENNEMNQLGEVSNLLDTLNNGYQGEDRFSQNSGHKGEYEFTGRSHGSQGGGRFTHTIVHRPSHQGEKAFAQNPAQYQRSHQHHSYLKSKGVSDADIYVLRDKVGSNNGGLGDEDRFQSPSNRKSNKHKIHLFNIEHGPNHKKVTFYEHNLPIRQSNQQKSGKQVFYSNRRTHQHPSGYYEDVQTHFQSMDQPDSKSVDFNAQYLNSQKQSGNRQSFDTNYQPYQPQGRNYENTDGNSRPSQIQDENNVDFNSNGRHSFQPQNDNQENADFNYKSGQFQRGNYQHFNPNDRPSFQRKMSSRQNVGAYSNSGTSNQRGWSGSNYQKSKKPRKGKKDWNGDAESIGDEDDDEINAKIESILAKHSLSERPKLLDIDKEMAKIDNEAAEETMHKKRKAHQEAIDDLFDRLPESNESSIDELDKLYGGSGMGFLSADEDKALKSYKENLDKSFAKLTDAERELQQKLEKAEKEENEKLKEELIKA